MFISLECTFGWSEMQNQNKKIANVCCHWNQIVIPSIFTYKFICYTYSVFHESAFLQIVLQSL